MKSPSCTVYVGLAQARPNKYLSAVRTSFRKFYTLLIRNIAHADPCGRISTWSIRYSNPELFSVLGAEMKETDSTCCRDSETKERKIEKALRPQRKEKQGYSRYLHDERFHTQRCNTFRIVILCVHYHYYYSFMWYSTARSG